MTEKNIIIKPKSLNEIEYEPEIIFEYKNSFLSVLQLKDGDKLIKLIDKCVEDMYEKDICETEPEITVMGRKCNQKRNVGFVSDESEGYKYSGQTAESKPTTSSFRKLLRKVNQIYDSDYNSILINEYMNGTNTIGRHSDSKKDLDINAGVVSLSIGAGRKFRVRRIGYDIDDEHKKHIPPVLFEHITGNYEFLQMGGRFQEELTHEIPTEARIKEKRISFTFRKFNK